METQLITLGESCFEILTDGSEFLGIGKVWIGETLVRSGRLPWRVTTQTYASAQELVGLDLLGVDTTPDTLRIRMSAKFAPALTSLKWDHSLDPVHKLGDLDNPQPSAEGELELVLTPASDRIQEIDFTGFAFHWEYRSTSKPLFFLYDMSSWELDGDITGSTVYSQSSSSDPVVTFTPDTAWTTEGLIHWEDDASRANAVMTHNLPRWVCHQAFDYQFKGNRTLIGLWERVDLIRSILRREAGKPELKTFDKYIFDETMEIATPKKRIVLSTAPRTVIDQQNLWTWTIEEVHRRARAEFGIHEELLLPRLSVNYWYDFTIDSYYRDLLPAAVNCGFKALFVDNLNESNMTRGLYNGSMCNSFEFVPSPKLGGTKALKTFYERCQEHGIVPYSWTNPSQSPESKQLLDNHHKRYTEGWEEWFVRMNDTRSPYGGAYIPEGGGAYDLSQAGPRDYWTDCLLKIKEDTGHHAYLWDSFYNTAFMPITYSYGRPRTIWRGALQAMKKMQDAGMHFMIESFGPFGEVQHGCPVSYNIDNVFVCYKSNLGSGYTTIPGNQELVDTLPDEASKLNYVLAHMTKPSFDLFRKGERIDKWWSDAHRQALMDYHATCRQMSRRFLQEDGLSVLWHNADGTLATLWNFADREVALPGNITDVTIGVALPAAETNALHAGHVYTIADVASLPRVVISAALRESAT